MLNRPERESDVALQMLLDSCDVPAGHVGGHGINLGFDEGGDVLVVDVQCVGGDEVVLVTSAGV